MSYGGYERVLCHNGHLHEEGCYMGSGFLNAEWRCPDCSGPKVWWEGVDQTNDAGSQTQLVLHDGHECICGECGHGHPKAAPQYCIPGKPDPNDPSIMLPIKPLPRVPVVRCGYTLISTAEVFSTEEALGRRMDELWREEERERVELEGRY